MAGIKRAATSGITKSGTAIPDVPDAPTIGTATDVGTSRAYNNGSATVAYTAAVTGGAVTTFTATSTPGGFTATGSSPITVTGLQSGTSYTFAVSGANSTGTQTSASSSSMTATTVPQAPTIGTATAGSAGSGQASVTFTAGATGGKAISTYTATSSPGSVTGTNSSSPIVVNGLTMGTAYTFTVTATNANGTSSASSASNSVTPVDATFMARIAYASAGTQQSTSVVADSSGNIYVGGYINPSNISSSYYYRTLHKFSTSGTLNWTAPHSYYYGSNDAGNSLLYGLNVDSSGNVYAAGTQNAIDSTYSGVYWLNVAKYNSSGTITDQKTVYKYNIGGSANYSTGYGVATDSSGNVYTAGGVDFDVDNIDFSIVKLDSSFAYQAAYRYQRPGPNGSGEQWQSIAIDSSNGIYVTGNYTVQTLISKGVYAYTGTVVLLKADTSGAITWQRAFSDYSYNHSIGSGMLVTDSSGNVYALLSTDKNNIQRQGVLAKWNSSGTLQWQRYVYNTSGGGVNSLAIDSSSNLYVLGTDSSTPAVTWIAKYNSSGTIQWQRSLAIDSTYTYGSAITVSGNNLIVAGKFATNYNSGYYDAFVIKVPTDGSKTGTYSVGGKNYVYSTTSIVTDASGGLTEISGSISTPSGTASNATGTLATRSISLTTSSTSI